MALFYLRDLFSAYSLLLVFAFVANVCVHAHAGKRICVFTCMHVQVCVCVCVCMFSCLSVCIISFIKFSVSGINVLLEVQLALFILWMSTLYKNKIANYLHPCPLFLDIQF